MSIRYLPDSPPPERYRRRPVETWQAAREDYAAGVPAAEVAERHGLGQSNVYKRAQEEGWRRRGLDDPDPEPVVVGGAPADPHLLAEQAWARAARAVERGRVMEARRWTELAERFNAIKSAQEAQRRADREARRTEAAAAEAARAESGEAAG
jgi:hypothetical protein